MSETNGLTRWGAWAAVGLAAVSAFIWVGTLASDMKQYGTSIDGLQRRVDLLEDQRRVSAITIAEIQRDAREIETQFCAGDIVRNLMHASDLRYMSMVWNKVYGEAYPIANAYYPQVCNRPQAK